MEVTLWEPQREAGKADVQGLCIHLRLLWPLLRLHDLGWGMMRRTF